MLSQVSGSSGESGLNANQELRISEDQPVQRSFGIIDVGPHDYKHAFLTCRISNAGRVAARMVQLTVDVCTGGTLHASRVPTPYLSAFDVIASGGTQEVLIVDDGNLPVVVFPQPVIRYLSMADNKVHSYGTSGTGIGAFLSSVHAHAAATAKEFKDPACINAEFASHGLPTHFDPKSEPIKLGT